MIALNKWFSGRSWIGAGIDSLESWSTSAVSVEKPVGKPRHYVPDLSLQIPHWSIFPINSLGFQVVMKEHVDMWKGEEKNRTKEGRWKTGKERKRSHKANNVSATTTRATRALHQLPKCILISL